MAMATVKLSSPAAGLLAGGRPRRSAPARRATVIRAAAGSYSDELVSTAVSAPTKPYMATSPSQIVVPLRRQWERINCGRIWVLGWLHVSYAAICDVVMVRCWYLAICE